MLKWGCIPYEFIFILLKVLIHHLRLIFISIGRI